MTGLVCDKHGQECPCYDLPDSLFVRPSATGRFSKNYLAIKNAYFKRFSLSASVKFNDADKETTIFELDFPKLKHFLVFICICVPKFKGYRYG